MLITRQTYNLLVESFERAVLMAFDRFKEERRNDPDVLDYVFSDICDFVGGRVDAFAAHCDALNYPQSDFGEILTFKMGMEWGTPNENLRAWIKQRFDAVDICGIMRGKVFYNKEVA